MGFAWDEVKEDLFRFERDTLVSASAGTGKTAALVELYLRIAEGRTALGDGVTPHNILALTFTRKAAGEMRERLREALLAKRRDNPGDKRYARMLELLSDAVIGTFDSFCMRLLREHHFEAALPPDFSLLPEDEARRLLLDSTIRVMRRLLSEGHAGLLLLLENNSFDQVTDDLLNVAKASEVLSGSRPDFQAEKEALPDKMNAELDAYGKGLEEVRSSYLATGAVSDKLSVGLEEIIRHFEIYGKPEKRPTPETARRAGMDFFSGPEGLVRHFKTVHTNSWKSFKETRRELLSHLDAAQFAFERLFAIDEAEAAFDIAVLIRREYAEAKAAVSMLDFEDVLVSAIDLLATRREIREQWQSRFDVILVDEFQDTNRIQLRLINLLSRDADFIARGARPTRRLYVGDRKQSIYRFRGADVSVFRQIENDWKGREDAKILHFRRNFRSNAHLLQFSNALFGRLLDDGSQDYQSSYSKEDDLLPGLEYPGQGAPVELLRVNKSILSRQEDRLRAESEAIALRLHEMIAINGLEIGQSDKSRKATYEDVAVLVRKKHILPAFERAFRRAGLPFSVVDGSGLFQRNEVLDLIAAARLLIEPWNTVALLTVLRSPAVHLSDNSIFRLHQHCEKSDRKLDAVIKSATDCAALCEGASIPGVQQKRLLYFVEVYGDLAARRRLMPASEIFEELLERLDLEAVAACGHESERVTANQHKLLRLLHEIENRNGTSDLYAALRRLDDMLKDDRGPGEAPQNACGIQIMTIHQAKGLEFPIVVLPAVEIKAGIFKGRLLADGRAGVIVKTRSKLESDPFEERKEAHKNMELAEERRIYYVAATRAKDRLVIGTNFSEGKGGERDEEGESTAAIALADEIEMAASACGLAMHITEIDGQMETEPAKPAAQSTEMPTAAEIERLCAEAQAHDCSPSMLGTFSVTMLHDFHACERRYHLKRMLERSTNLWMEAPYADEETPEGASLGLLVHCFLEAMPLGVSPQAKDISGFFATAAQQDSAGADRAVCSLERFFASEWYAELSRQINTNGAALHREMPFIAELEMSEGRRARLKGRIDLLIEPPDGELRLIDYKYARSNTPRAEDYIMQVAVYARALERAWPGRPMAAEIVYLAGSGEIVRIESGSPQALAAIARFEQSLCEAHALAGLPYAEWRNCDAETCRADACRFMKLCGVKLDSEE